MMANKQDKPKKEGRRVEVSSLPRGGKEPAMGEGWKKWSQLVAQVWANDKLKQRLLSDPAAVLREYGMEVPAGVEIRVVEDTDKIVYLSLPAKPAGDVAELTAHQMKAVMGGAMWMPRCG